MGLLGSGLVSQIAMGVVVAVLAIVVLVAAQTVWRLAQGRNFSRAVGRSAGTTAALLSGMITVLTIGVIQGGQAIDVVINAIASAPIAATQVVTIILGAIGISTGRIGLVAFVAGAITFAAFARVLTEVRA